MHTEMKGLPMWLIESHRERLARVFRKPGFALAVILILALGIGANTATLNLLYGYLLAPLPYPHANRLVSVYFTARKIPGNLGMSYRTYLDLRSGTTGMRDAGMVKVKNVNFAAGAQVAHVRGAAVSASVFTTLAVRPILGRVFGARANQPGAAPEVLLSERLWSRLFQRNPNVLGRTVSLNGRGYTVIGVMPGRFGFPDAHTDLWLAKSIGPFDYEADNLTAWNDAMIARLAPGVSPAQLAVQAQAALEREIAHFPDPSAIPQFQGEGLRIAVTPLRSALLGSLGGRLVLAQLATGLLLLLVWINLANLFIARALAQRGELIVRRVLGADLWVLFQQMFLESLVLALIGCAAGAVFGDVLVRTLLRMGFADTPVSFPARDWAVTGAIAVALAVLSALVFSSAGLHFIRRQDLARGLRNSDARSGGGRSERRVRGALVVTQLALAFTLSGVGMLLVRSLFNLNAVHLGFRAGHVVTFEIHVPLGESAGWKSSLRAELSGVRSALARVPGVQTVTLASDIPFDGASRGNTAYPNPYDGKRSPSVFPIVTDPGYFRTFAIGLLAGRLFAASDATSNTGDALIDARAAHVLFGTTDAVGRRFNFDAPNDSQPNLVFRVIGVLADTRQAHLGSAAPQGVVYLDRDQVLRVRKTMWSWASPNWYVAVRTPLRTATVLPLLTTTLHSRLPEVPLYAVHTMHERLARRLAPRRAVTALVLMFALAALSVAAVGLYSVQSYLVGQRRPEFGLRAALGADRGRLRRLVMRETAVLLALGCTLGGCGAVLLGQAFSASLYGVRGSDPFSLVLVATVLGLIVLLAGWMPAWRASCVPPIEALRNR